MLATANFKILTNIFQTAPRERAKQRGNGRGIKQVELYLKLFQTTFEFTGFPKKTPVGRVPKVNKLIFSYYSATL